MRVAFVMPGVGVENRGGEAFVLELAAALDSREDFEIEISSRGESPLTRKKIRALARDAPWVESLYGASELGRKILDTLFLDPMNLEWSTAAVSAYFHLAEQAKRGRLDAVVMEGGLVGGWLCRHLRSLYRIPFIDIAHGVSPKWERAFARQRPDRVVTFTRAAEEMILEEVPDASIEVIPHGVDLELFRPGIEAKKLSLPRPIIMSCGAIDDHKQMDLTLEAVDRLGRGSLLVLGTGPGEEALDRLAKSRLGGSRYLRTTAPRREMPNWYAAADLFTLSSRSEAFGLVYLEAMACGLPVVAPDDAVRREVIGDAGILVNGDDAASLARALDEGLSRDWGGIPRRRAESFPFSDTAEAYAGLLRKIEADRS